MSLSSRILIGLAAGVGVGIFLGELASPLGILGRAFVLLLQMTVLPFVAVSLIGSLGSLRYDLALTLARTAGIFLLLIWGISITVVLLVPLAFPDWESASFFSTSLVSESKGVDFLSLFIPANPFRSLSDSVVPAVVVFSIALGLALIGMEGKDGLIRALNTLADAIGNITNAVMYVAPVGVFAIAANAAGNMDVAQLQGLQIYATVTVAMALLLGFWTLPMLVTTLTDIRYGQLMEAYRDALVTAFATASVFVVLPILADRSRELVQRGGEDEESAHLSDVTITTSFNVPSSGKLLPLGFVLFAGWFSGFPISVSEYPAFVAAGLPSFFGSTVIAVPFMLDMFRVPADMFELFLIADNVIVGRFGSFTAAMFMITLTLLATTSASGGLRRSWPRIGRYAVVTIGLTLLTLLGIRFGFDAMSRQYQGYHLFVDRGLLQSRVETRALDQVPDQRPAVDLSTPTLQRIVDRGVLRAGYRADNLPFAFRNSAGDLVGFDVEMLHRLASDLGVRLEMVRVETGSVPALLAEGYLDISTSAPITPRNLTRVAFARAHLDDTLAFIVRDHRRSDFGSRHAVQSLDSLRLMIPRLPYYIEIVKRYLPQAEITIIDSPRAYFRGEHDADALVLGAATGSAWALVYPDFTVALPHPDLLSVPLAYELARGDLEMVEFMSSWIELKRKDRTVSELFEYWLEGKAPREAREPRWSVIRNVLGWVD